MSENKRLKGFISATGGAGSEIFDYTTSKQFLNQGIKQTSSHYELRSTNQLKPVEL